MDVLLKHVTEENLYGKILRLVKAVKGDTTQLAKKIRKKQGYKTSEIPVQEKMEAQYLKRYEELIDQLYRGIARALGLSLQKADGDEPFKIKGKIFYSPATGKPLTKKEWNSIKDAISKFLGINTKDLAERMALEQHSLGNVLQRLEAQGVRVTDATTTQVAPSIYDAKGDYVKSFDWTEEELYDLDTNIERLGNHITGINDDIRKDIVTVINDGLSNHETKKEISRTLLDKLGDRNRDWQRIVSTESQYAFQTGYSRSLLKTDEREVVYVEVISQADACKYCKSLISGRVFILTDDASKIGKKPKDPYAVGYIVVGSTNVGNKPAEYIPTIPMHPFCRCRTVVWHKEYAELEEDIRGQDSR